MNADPSVTYQTTGGVAHLELNRPGVANAFDLETARRFQELIEAAGDDGEVRAVLVTGAGKRFCAGGDVASFVSAQDQPDYIHQLASELDASFRALAGLDKPVVAAVRGAVAGAGLGLLLSADVAIAAPDTKFAFAYPGIGFTPDCGVSYLLPRAIGSSRALAFALTGQVLLADQARQWGLVAEVDPDPVTRALELASTWASGPAWALGQTRRLLRAGWELGREETGREEARTISEAVRGDEAQALLREFLQRSR